MSRGFLRRVNAVDSNIDASGKNGFRINWNHAVEAARHSLYRTEQQL
jgi:hypothetical protein